MQRRIETDMTIAPPMDRRLVEQIVREIVLAQVGGPPGKPNLVVSVSARHVHLTNQDVETLFGAGHKLTIAKNLYQDTGDVFNKESSQRQYYTTPNTTAPNAQTAFAKWAYQAPPTCKEEGIKCAPLWEPS